MLGLEPVSFDSREPSAFARGAQYFRGGEQGIGGLIRHASPAGVGTRRLVVSVSLAGWRGYFN